jgi:hypothetical protein
LNLLVLPVDGETHFDVRLEFTFSHCSSHCCLFDVFGPIGWLSGADGPRWSAGIVNN